MRIRWDCTDCKEKLDRASLVVSHLVQFVQEHGESLGAVAYICFVNRAV